MSSSVEWFEWDARSPLARGVDAGGIAVACELITDVLAYGEPNDATLQRLRHWLATPRWEHCAEVSVLPIAILRDRVARMIVAATETGADDLLAYYQSRGELIDDAPDDISGIERTGDQPRN